MRSRDRRQAPKLLAEVLSVRIPPASIICNDSIYARINPQNQHCLTVLEDDGSLRARLSLELLSDPQYQFWRNYALADKPTVTFQTQALLPDSIVFSPGTTLLPTSTGAYIYDARFSQYLFVDAAAGKPSAVVSANAWPLAWAHQRLFGDTTQWQEAKEIIAQPKLMGRRHLTLVNMFTLQDTLFGIVEYLHPRYKRFDGKLGVEHEPELFLVRLAQGQPRDWRHIELPVGNDFYAQPYFGVTRRGRSWHFPIMHYDQPSYSTQVPIEGRLDDLGAELCPIPEPQRPENHLPASLTGLRDPYLFSEYRYARHWLIFQHVNRLADTKSGSLYTLPDFTEKNTFVGKYAEAVASFNVKAATATDENVFLLVNSSGKMYYVVLDQNAQVLLICQYASPSSQTTQWGFGAQGQIWGFDTETNALLRVKE